LQIISGERLGDHFVLDDPAGNSYLQVSDAEIQVLNYFIFTATHHHRLITMCHISSFVTWYCVYNNYPIGLFTLEMQTAKRLMTSKEVHVLA
jgi:hypothetical protein